jgi:hypothetical protein
MSSGSKSNPRKKQPRRNIFILARLPGLNSPGGPLGFGSTELPVIRSRSLSSGHNAAREWTQSLFIVILSGVRLSPLHIAAITGILYQPQMIDDGDCGAISGIKIGRGSRSTRRKAAPAPLCPPQIPHDQTWCACSFTRPMFVSIAECLDTAVIFPVNWRTKSAGIYLFSAPSCNW